MWWFSKKWNSRAARKYESREYLGTKLSEVVDDIRLALAEAAPPISDLEKVKKRLRSVLVSLGIGSEEENARPQVPIAAPQYTMEELLELNHILVQENIARRRYIKILEACRDHWKASYESLAKPPLPDAEPKDGEKENMMACLEMMATWAAHELPPSEWKKYVPYYNGIKDLIASAPPATEKVSELDYKAMWNALKRRVNNQGTLRFFDGDDIEELERSTGVTDKEAPDA